MEENKDSEFRPPPPGKGPHGAPPPFGHGYFGPPPPGKGPHGAPPPFGPGCCGPPPPGKGPHGAPPPFPPQFEKIFDALFTDREFARWNPFVKVEEKEDHFLVKALVPGFEKEQIMLSAHETDLLIEAKRQTEENETSEPVRPMIMEAFRFWDKPTLEYIIPLPETIDPNSIKAKLTQGILTIRIPRKKPEKINIE
jgi:HSP20 family protein